MTSKPAEVGKTIPVEIFQSVLTEVMNSLIMKITVNENDINDILQTLR